jgi:hypothetical protein
VLPSRLNEPTFWVMQLDPTAFRAWFTQRCRTRVGSVGRLREVRTPGAGVAHGSARDRRLIQPTTVTLPTILPDTHLCVVHASARVRSSPAQPRVRAMAVKIALEITELHLQIRSRPEQRAVEKLPPNRADQPFDEWMRERHERYRLDGFHVEDSQIRLPLVKSIQRIMIRAEVRRRRLATHGSIEHSAQCEFDFHEAVEVCRLMEPHHPFIVEDPLREEQFRT